ncbi:TonB-dependent receptor plug domain-containing protein [Butyricimonas virosa]
MLKMNIKMLLGVVWILIACTGAAIAQTLSASYKNQSLEVVLADLKQKTNYNFVYQKQVLKDAKPITATFNNVELPYILDRVLYNNGLDYEILKETVVIKKAERETFKKVVNGRVLDENGEPLPGVNVRVKDTHIGVATGVDGEFSISVTGDHPVLIFSFIGMQDKEVRITQVTQNPVIVEMRQDVAMMDEVIVTGYQNIKRENATGSYQLITAKDMDKRYTVDVVSNLEGKIPGLVSYNNGKNGSGEDALTIRGVGSFQAKTSPLIVVDGLPIEGSIETVNRYDIESITVLKDASAAAVYGARASNGVIVITTKRADSEKLAVDISADLTVSELQKYGNYRWASPAQLIELEEYNFANVRDNYSEAYSGMLGYYNQQQGRLAPILLLMLDREMGKISDIEYQAQIEKWKKNNYRKEWQDLMLRNQLVHQYNVALRSKGKYLNSNIILNYKGNNTGMEKQHDNALNLAYKGDVDLKPLQVSVGLNLIRENSKMHADRFGYKDMHAFAPYLSMYNEDGTPADMRAEV